MSEYQTSEYDVLVIGAGGAGLRAAIEGIKQRGNTDLGDKTLLDALVPATDTLEANLGEGAATVAVTDRATVGNMAPEYGATLGFWPIDEQTCRYNCDMDGPQ